jgi:hypothetical protein
VTIVPQPELPESITHRCTAAPAGDAHLIGAAELAAMNHTVR